MNWSPARITFERISTQASVVKSGFAEVEIKTTRGVSCIRQTLISVGTNGANGRPDHRCDLHFDRAGNFVNVPSEANLELVNSALVRKLELHPPGQIQGTTSGGEATGSLYIKGEVARTLYNLFRDPAKNSESNIPTTGERSSGSISCIRRYVEQRGRGGFTFPKLQISCDIGGEVIPVSE